MAQNLELIERAIEDFKTLQRNMILAREENAKKTYASLKEDYISKKAFLSVAGVNLTGIDMINED